MWKKILITVGIIVVLLGAAAIYLNHRNRTLSPPGSVELSNGDLTIHIDYSRPSVRDRLVFGSKEEDALQPWGEYWRLGANESTEVMFSRDVKFNGEAVSKGTYRMYAIPGPEEFVVALNSELGVWGAMEPDYDLDIMKTKVPVKPNDHTEQYTIELEKSGDGILIHFLWDEIRFSVPVE